MLLSHFYTYVGSPRRETRLAALSDDMIQTLIKRYRVNEDLDSVKHIQNYFQSLTHQSDLIVEWILKSISRRSGRYPDDMPRFENILRFFFDRYKTPKFRQVVQQYAQDNRLSLNPRNLLDFTLHELEDIRELFYEEPVDPRVNQLESKLPEGASLFYNDGVYQIVEVESAQAACSLARGTRWCTNTEEKAESYLQLSPLYVIYIKGKKTAQFHIGLEPEEIQLMDLRDRGINPDEQLRQVWIKSGLMDKIIQVLERHNYPYSADAAEDMRRWLGSEDNPQIRELILDYPLVALMYALYVIKGRFLEAEPMIAQEPSMALDYAMYVIKGRFPLAEDVLIPSDVFESYADFLWSTSRKSYQDFLNTHLDDQSLNRYRDDINSLPSHVG